MSVHKPDNNELSNLESFLDNECNELEGSSFFSTLESIFEDLDEVISDLKSRVSDLENEVEELSNE